MRKILFIVLGTAIVVGCGGNGNKDAKVPVAVEAVVVNGGNDGGNGHNYIGSVEESASTPVSFATSGLITHKYVRDGQLIRKGQLIATVDNSNATNEYEFAKATLDRARDGYARAKIVYERGSLPEIKWVEVQTQYNQALHAAELAKRHLEDCNLHSPVGGTVSNCNFEVGTQIMPGMPLMNVVNTSCLYVRMSIPETDVNQISIGMPVNISVSALPKGESELKGTVVERDIEPDRLSHSYPFRVRLQQHPASLLPGMVCRCYVEGVKPTTSASVCVVPNRAVQLANDGSRFVWVIRQGLAHKQPVTIGDLNGTGVVVSEGLAEGEQVIVNGMLRVTEGTKVHVVN